MAAGPCDTACGVETCLLSTTAPLLNCFWQSLRRAAAKSIGASQRRQRPSAMLSRICARPKPLART